MCAENLWCKARWPSHLFMANMPTKKHPRLRVACSVHLQVNHKSTGPGRWMHLMSCVERIMMQGGGLTFAFIDGQHVISHTHRPRMWAPCKKRLGDLIQIDTSGWWWDFVTAEMHLHAALVQKQYYGKCWQNILSNQMHQFVHARCWSFCPGHGW